MNLVDNIKKERNYGIDLLRIISMLFVVILHSLGHGGVLNNVVDNSSQYRVAWFMEIFAYCAVDIFALISGYVSYSDKDKKVNCSRYINIWLQVVYYGILITLIFDIIDPSIVSRRDYFIVLLPVTNGLYWYFSAYTGLFVMMPFLNKALKSINKVTMKKIFIVIILAFSFFEILVNKFTLANGYSVIWLVLLYILGATIKKCEIGKKLKNYQIIIGIFILYSITYLYKLYGIERTILNVSIKKSLFVSYISPTILIIAILYVILFSRFKFNNIFKRIIKFGSSSAFSVYIINENDLIRKYVMQNSFNSIIKYSSLKIFIYIISFAILFVIASILIDKIRIFLFEIIHVKTISNKISNTLERVINRISNVI